MTAHQAIHTSSRSRRTHGPTRTQCRQEILSLLKRDHRLVEQAFKEFEKLHHSEEKADKAVCRSLVTQTCLELTAHARLEEVCFYPAIRDALGAWDLIDEAEVEHQTLKMLIARLEDMRPGDDKYAATFMVLGEYVMHHVKEEEGELFRKLTRASVDWPSLLGAMRETRERIMEELGLPHQAVGADGSESKRRSTSH